MKARRAVKRLALIWAPLLAIAAVGGWLLVPGSRPALVAASDPTSTTVAGAVNPHASSSTTTPTPSTTIPGATTTTTAPPTGPSNGTPNHPAASPGVPVNPAAAAANIVGANGVTAKVLWQQDCAACHGMDGRGTNRAPSLAGVGEAAVDFMLTTGRMPKKDSPSRMEPFSPILPEADIKALDRYVTALVAHGGPGIPTVNPKLGDTAKGHELFDEECAACHDWSGSGGILFNRPVPALTEATPTQLGEALRIGPAAMPKFGPKELDASQVNAIDAYVQNMKHPYDNGGDPISHLGPFAEGAVAWLIAAVGVLFVARWIGKRG